MDSQDLIGFAYLTLIITTLGMITGACLMRRIDAIAHAIDEIDKRYVY